MRRITSILILGLLFVYSEAVALAASSSAAKLLSKQADEYYAKGLKDTEIGNLDEAMKYYQKAVAMNPSFAQAHYELAKIYQAKGWIERAEESYRRASNLDPSLSIPQAIIYQQEHIAESYPAEKEGIVKEARAWAKEIESESGAITAGVRYPAIGIRMAQGPVSVTYLETTKNDTYPAEKKGPAVNTILDPYHPKHEDFKIPYIKDREGLKLTPVVGIRGEYMVDRQLVGIESLIQEAQEFDQRTDEQMRKYVSINDKEYHKEEIVLHYKETWPKFTYTYLEERVRREYDAKLLWSANNVYYDNYNKRFYQLEHTIPDIEKLGALNLKFRYGYETGYKPNDPAAYKNLDSYFFGVETFPYIALIDKTIGVKLEHTYIDGNFSRREENGLDDQWSKERNYNLEFDLYYPEKYLRIKPHFYYKKERNYPDYNTWWTRKNGVKVEKNLNGKFKLITDWTYIDYARDKDPYLSGAKHLSASAWKSENDLEYEFIRDWKLKFGCDYGNGLGFKGFDYYTLRTELQLKKPGLTEFRLGYGHTNYFEINDSVDTFLFKIGLFI